MPQRPKNLALLFSLLLLSSPLKAAPLLPKQNPSSVGAPQQVGGKIIQEIDIQFEGGYAKPGPILDKMKTKVSTHFSHDTFDADLHTLSLDFYGIPETELIPLPNGNLKIQIKLKIKPKIDSIEIIGAGDLTKNLKEKLGTQKAGEILDEDLLRKAVEEMHLYLVQKGYFQSEIKLRPVKISGANLAEVKIVVDKGAAGYISGIEVEGVTKEEKTAILKLIQTKKYMMFLSLFTGDGTYSPDMIAQDKVALIDYLHNEGFASAKVDIEAPASSKDRIKLILKINKGPKYHIGTVSFKGNIDLSNEEIEKYLLIKKEDLYTPKSVNAAVEQLKALYGSKGYGEAVISADATPIMGKHLYNVRFDIEESEKLKVASIKIVGNVTTQDTVILRESLLSPGDFLDSRKLKATEQRLQNIGYFKTVQVHAVKTGDSGFLGPEYRDVYIEVEETSTGSVNFSFGFSSAEEVSGAIDLVENNFSYKGLFGLTEEGIVGLRGGGEYMHLRANIGSKSRVYSLSWMTPYLFDSRWRYGFEISESHSDLQSKDFGIDSTSVTTYASYPINAFWTYGVRYRVKLARIKTDSIKEPLPGEINLAARWVDFYLSNDKHREERRGKFLSAVGTSLSFDSTDNPWKPRQGLRSTLEGDFAGVGGRHTFLRATYCNSYYKSFWNKGIFKLRGDVRFLFPIWKTHGVDKIPLNERFFLGGDSTVRGFKDFKIGPKFKNSEDPRGGTSSFLFSAEYLHEIMPMVDAFVFADAGSLALKTLKVGRIVRSTGFGMRFQLMGQIPIVVGYAFPKNGRKTKGIDIETTRDNNGNITAPYLFRGKSYQDEKQQFFFSLAGQF